MRSTLRWITALAAGSLLAVACEQTPTSIDSTTPRFSNGAERTVEQYLYDMADSQFVFACTDQGDPLPIDQGEHLQLEGQVFERITLLYDGAGGLHYNVNTMPVDLRGVGVISGEEFRIRETDRYGANQRLAGGTGSYKQELTMVGTDTGRKLKLVFSGHYVISAEGEIKVSHDTERMECKAK
jgi:hypothetical protein